jgi:hypothetical protein
MNEWFNATKDCSSFTRSAKITVNTDISSMLPILARKRRAMQPRGFAD